MIETIEAVLLDIIRGVYEFAGWPGVVVLMALESACIPLPSEIIMPFAGWFLVQEKGLGVEWVFLLALFGAFGNLLGSLAAYWVGAAGGRWILEKYGKYILISRHDLDLADNWFAKRGALTVFVSRVLPVVRTFISLPAGIARMNLLKFSILTFVGSFPFSFALAYGGYRLGEHWEAVRTAMRPFDIPIIIIGMALVALYIWWHVRRAWKQPEA